MTTYYRMYSEEDEAYLAAAYNAKSMEEVFAAFKEFSRPAWLANGLTAEKIDRDWSEFPDAIKMKVLHMNLFTVEENSVPFAASEKMLTRSWIKSPRTVH